MGQSSRLLLVRVAEDIAVLQLLWVWTVTQALLERDAGDAEGDDAMRPSAFGMENPTRHDQSEHHADEIRPNSLITENEPDFAGGAHKLNEWHSTSGEMVEVNEHPHHRALGKVADVIHSAEHAVEHAVHEAAAAASHGLHAITHHEDSAAGAPGRSGRTAVV